MLALVAAVLIVISGSALCSSVEAALFSVSTLKARQLAQSKNPAAVALLAIRDRMNRPIATIVVLNNIFNIVGSIAIARIAETVLGNTLLGVFSGLLTFLIIIFGEIIPKTLGERYSQRLALLAALPVTALTFIFTPLVWIMEKVTAPFTRKEKLPTTNESEIMLLAKIGYQEGIIEDDEAEMIQRVFMLNDLTAADLMTPRTALTYLRGDLTLAASRVDIINSQHTRIIVIEDSLDRVIGVTLKDELLTAMVEGKRERKIAEFTRKVRFVPETIHADRLLRAFQKSRNHLVVVVDEYGTVSGVVTLEDVLEILTGEIVDETDKIIDLQAAARNRLARMLKIQ
ncbi:HlyC/CorC family transporter [Chroococcidiopsis sp. FACHB-1243]|uniref:hemolysin family protein n=1 Tax=Chroococcidiopsis sp. [FACHB-1243] TaxID=2692781 RepID=UPI001782758F|nr:hemolysin family protein [Chroococcidiopsis sp. [FACHB-1243]]MBD2307585.1 HlyC/CorC family transporter [Chroococcidiopsis sp. [FACHB-1243]]